MKFITPRNPAIHPVMPDPAPTVAILSELVRTQKHEVRLFKEYHAVDRACKKVISKLIPEKFYKSLSSGITGFAKVTSLKILTHLITEYAELEEEYIQEIDRKIKEPISGGTLCEEFIEQIEGNQETVAVQNPYSPAQIVSMAYANIDKCGLYQNDFRNWSRKTQIDKTWGNFKAHFSLAFKGTRRFTRTLRTKGYVAHVHAAQASVELFTKMQQYHTLVLANVATATQADRTSVGLLKKTISELSVHVALLTAKLATVQAEICGWRNQDNNQPQLGMEIGRLATRPCWSLTQVKIKTYILEADRGSTLMGTSPPTDTKWRSRTRQRHAVFQSMSITSQLRD